MTRVLVDTNVFISALLFPESVPARALSLVIDENELVCTQWVLEELKRVVEEKRPDLLPALDELLADLDYELVEPANIASAVVISDRNDQPILDAALAAAGDVIVTGDKRFHALDIRTPSILTAREFIEKYPPQQVDGGEAHV